MLWYKKGLRDAPATAGVLDAAAAATGTATPAKTDPAMPSVTRGEMMARLMRMFPPRHACRLQAFIWRKRPADASSVMSIYLPACGFFMHYNKLLL